MELPDPGRSDEARAWFEPLGLDGLERRRSGELSGGQAQRVALARGLVSRPEVLFADEPTGSLDSLTGEQVMELLVAATRRQGTTVVLVTHEARVAAYAGREVMVRDGKASSLSSGRVQSMMRLGLRLTINGGKEAAVRLAIIVGAVALGVGLLLIVLAGMNGINAQNARSAWLNTGSVFGPAGPGGARRAAGSSPVASPSNPLWWLSTTDNYKSHTIDVVDVAATGPDSPVPPGLSHLPGPGQFYASPALTKLLRSTPANELADRYPGTQIGTIGPAALPAPNSLIIVIGHTPAQMSALPGASEIASINTSTTHISGANGWDSNKLQVILAVGALALLFPVLIFIATATRLSAARREQRFAALRLVGATPRQVSMISAVESSVGGLGGVAIGFGVFFLLRPVLTGVDFTGEPFAHGDLSLNLIDVLLVIIGVPLAAAVAARIAMRRVQISPLGVTRRVTPPMPRAYRLLPLVAGIAELAYFVAVGTPKGTGAQILAYFSGCFLIMAGLVIAGPWLTMVGSRLMAGRAHRPAALLAGRRLSDNPRAAFRAISGLIIALFATSVSVGVITTILGNAPSGTGSSGASTLLQQFGGLVGRSVPAPGQTGLAPPAVSDHLLAELRSIPHVQGVTLLYEQPDAQDTLLVSCAQLSHTPGIGRCAPGAVVAAVGGNLDVNPFDVIRQPIDARQHRLARRPDLSRPAGRPDRRCRRGRDQPVDHPPSNRLAPPSSWPSPIRTRPRRSSEINANSTRSITELQQMTNVVIAASLVIAGCSLAVSVTGGVNERKRPFSLLRLTGVPLSVLRRVVALEAAVPLLIISVLSAAMGFLAAGLFLNAQLGYRLRAPGPGYYALVGAGLVASLAIIAATLPLIERITGPEVARNE